MLLLFIKKYWSWILNILFILVIIFTVNYYRHEIAVINTNSIDQFQEYHLEYEKNLNDVISQKTIIQQQMSEEINKIQEKSSEDIQLLITEHDQTIKELARTRDMSLEKLKAEKSANIKRRIKISHENPNEMMKEIADKFGFKVIKND